MQECRSGFPGTGETGDGADETGAPGLHRRLGVPSQAAPFWAGAAWALFAISIWAGWFISTRFGAGSGLTAYDIVTLRFGVTALVLLPITLRLRGGLGLLRWRTALALFAGSGVPFSL